MTSRKSPRLYIPLDARFFDDDKILRAGERAAWLFLSILSAIKLDGADGTISQRKIVRLGIQGWQARLQKLEQVGLIMEMSSVEVDEITYLVPSWSRWNLLSYEVEARREAGREAAMKRWRNDANGNGSPNGAPKKHPIQREGKERKKEGREISTIGQSVDNLMERLERESSQ